VRKYSERHGQSDLCSGRFFTVLGNPIEIRVLRLWKPPIPGGFDKSVKNLPEHVGKGTVILSKKTDHNYGKAKIDHNLPEKRV
jgi:hypothetical protein